MYFVTLTSGHPADWVSKITSFKHQNGPSQHGRNQAQVTGGLHGWTKCSWQKSNVKRKRTRSRSRWPVRNTETPAECAGMGLGKARPARNWICWGNKKSSEKSFYRGISSKRKARKNVGPLLNRAGDLLMKDMRKAEVLNVTPIFKKYK